MSAVPPSERKPHWFSGRSLLSRCWMTRFSRMRAKILPAKDWQLPFSTVDMGYAGIFELLWELSFIPHSLEYLFHFLHHGCDTRFEHFSGDCVWSWHFASWELFDGLLDFSRWASYQGADWTPLEVGGQWYHHWFKVFNPFLQDPLLLIQQSSPICTEEGGRSQLLWSLLNSLQGIIKRLL